SHQLDKIKNSTECDILVRVDRPYPTPPPPNRIRDSDGRQPSLRPRRGELRNASRPIVHFPPVDCRLGFFVRVFSRKLITAPQPLRKRERFRSKHPFAWRRKAATSPIK